MKNFNREAIQRMFDGRKGGGGGGTNNADLAGYATQMWVNQNYVSIEFFNRLFSIHGHDPEDESTPPTDISVLPNDMDSIVDSIESMVGFWTEEYLSALGQNDDQGGGGITLNAALASINNSPLGNPTGTNTVLMFNGTTWVYASMGSTDMNTVWTALAAATNQQINISHLATALSGYATTSQLSDYATVTDLEQLASYFNTLSGYFTNGAANEAVKLETARTIWGQQFDGTANITGDITQATCLEFSGIAGTATNGGFIDFHYAGGGADYTSRIIEDVSGVLKINNTIWAQLSGNVSIGTSTISQTYKLDVAGYTKTTRLYLADGVYLEYDSTNSGVHLVGAGFYSDSYVSALGVNSGGGGGGSDYIPLTGSSSITGTLAPSVATADLGSSTNKWRNIYGTSLSISNTLTTYALTVNSSATVAGSITATNGNLVASTGYVSSAGGYKVTGKDDTSVLLAGGGTKPLSEIGSAYTLPAATAAALGGLKVNQSYGQAATVQASGNTGTRNYGLQIDSNGMGFVYVPWENTDNDTKNTAGATNLTATKMYLVGATEQSANPQTYSNSNCYIGTDNCLYSGGSKVLTGISSSDVTTALGFTPAATSDLNNYLPLTAGFDKPLTGSLLLSTTSGTSGWSNGVYVKDASEDITVFLASYHGTLKAGVYAHNNNLTAWEELCVGGYSIKFACNGSVKGEWDSSALKVDNHIVACSILHDDGFNYSSGLELREYNYTKNTYTDDIYAPAITFHWFNIRGERLYMASNGTLTYTRGISATSFKKSGGTSSQFLKADGSVDSNTYLTSASLSSYVTAIVVNSEQPVGPSSGVVTLSGIIKKIKIGSSSTEYTPSSGVVTLPAYPSGFVTGISVNGGTPIEPTSGIVGLTGLATTSDLSGYLPLTGGTLSGDIKAVSNRTSWSYRIICGDQTNGVAFLGTYNSTVILKPGVYAHNASLNAWANVGIGGSNIYFYADGDKEVGVWKSDKILYINKGLSIDAFSENETGIYFRHGFESSTTRYNVSILAYDHNRSGSSPDGLSLNGYDGVSICTGSNTRSERMRVDINGNVGIGTTSPSYKLHVDGAGYFTGKVYSEGNEVLTSGSVVTTNTAQSITGSKTFTATLTSSAGGSFTGGLRFYSLCVECASDGTPSSSRYGEINRYNNTLHLQYDSGTGGVTMCQQGFTFTNTGSTRSITINASLQLTCGSGTPYTDKNWVYNSDMRKKDVIRLIDMDAQRIADAPIFDFTWKSDAVKELTLGSSAQYWQKVFPNAVRTTPDGYLGMDYSSIALASAVLTARKVVDHEARIRLLEVENAALRNEINQLKKVA